MPEAPQYLQVGQRAFVGKVCMDRNSPDFYTASCQENLVDTLDFIKAVRHDTMLLRFQSQSVRILQKRGPAIAQILQAFPCSEKSSCLR